jgi:predicted  nucleic acid-binding Zn-ribbon protein
MPFSLDRQPEDDELECARCGAYFHYQLTRCPNCGVNIFEPDLDEGDTDREWFDDSRESRAGLHRRLDDFVRRIFRKPYRFDEVFGSAIDQAVLYDDLLQKVGGDRSIVERLLAYERQKHPDGTRSSWLQSAMRRWERDNRSSGSKKV